MVRMARRRNVTYTNEKGKATFLKPKKKKEYIVFCDMLYYPYVVGIYDDLKEAEKKYSDDLKYQSKDEKLYLCKIIQKATLKT